MNYFLSFEIVIMLVTAEELLVCGEIQTVLKINWEILANLTPESQLTWFIL